MLVFIYDCHTCLCTLLLQIICCIVYICLHLFQEPLNSADDVSEEDPNELFDAENVVVCQYDKVSGS